MEHFEADDGHVIVRLDPGDPALESIEAAIEERGVETGAVVTGIGTFRNLNIHYVHTAEFPEDQAERNTDLELEGAWEVTNVQGIIADGEPHLHVTAFDGERTVGGHLEEGCITHILGEFTIRPFEGIDLVRRPGEKNVSQLQAR